ncbi:DUF2971 domain-containing protein [Microbulbifer sp. TRSA007]|uniref:DUF2971 domain-containing protein n=1 Tax=Microbulbifer sp. TRSA007 TaxID=3243384 RepID=UPI00403A59ED
MKYYKYISDWRALPYLLKGSIKFTPISELNDPSELTSNIIREDVMASLDRLRERGYSDEDLHCLQQQGVLLSKLSPGSQAVPTPKTKEQATQLIRSSFYERVDLLETLLENTTNEISSKVGIFCVSKRFDSLPMWAHYANNANGLVVEFKNLDSIFTGDDTGILNQLVDVKYEREFYGVTFDPRSHEALFFYKFSDWSYEKEVRVVLPLASCSSSKFENHTIYTMNIPVTCISRVFLGWNMKGSEIDKARDVVNTNESKISLSSTKFNKGKITIDVSA